MKQVLIDTSSWIEALRKSGNPTIRQNVRESLLDGSATWCDMIRLELWNGAQGSQEKAMLLQLEKDVHCLSSTREVWNTSFVMARHCRSKGKSYPSTDLLIAAHALYYKVRLESMDAHHIEIMALFPDGKIPEEK